MSVHDDPLSPDEILAEMDLYGVEQVLGGEDLFHHVPYAGVLLGRPTVYEVPLDRFPESFQRLPDASRWRYARAVFPFAIESLDSRSAFLSATISVRLNDPNAAIFDLEPPNPIGPGGLVPALTAKPIPVHLPLAPGERPCGTDVRVEATGYGMSSGRWRLTDRDAGDLRPGSYVVGAVFQVPKDTMVLSGEVMVSTAMRRPFLGRFGRATARQQRPVAFGAPIDSPDPGRETPRSPGPQATTIDGTRRILVATDAKGYGQRDTRQQLALQHRLVGVLEATYADTGLDPDQWFRQPQGDGELAVLPPAIDEAGTVATVVRSMGTHLAHCNDGLSEQARVRVRLAMHEGPIYNGPLNLPGEAPVTVCRLRDSEPLRVALSAHPDADLVVAVSQQVFEMLTEVKPPGLRVDALQPLPVTNKEFIAMAWTGVVDQYGALTSP